MVEFDENIICKKCKINYGKMKFERWHKVNQHYLCPICYLFTSKSNL